MKGLEEIFHYEVFKTLKKESKINDGVIENMLSWYNSGFHVYNGDRIIPSDKTGLGNLVRYIIRACFSQARMICVLDIDSADGVAKVVYTLKDRNFRKIFNALARLATHITGRYEQAVRYYR